MDALNLPLILSGESESALTSVAEHWLRKLESLPDDEFTTFCLHQFTIPHAEMRSAIFATDKAGYLKGLMSLSQGRAARNVLTGNAGAGINPVLVFSGQGPLWQGMTSELLNVLPAYRQSADKSGEIFQANLGWNPADALAASEPFSRLKQIQPIQFTISSALADVWRAFGIREAAVVGHSVGEASAAYSAGYLSQEDATKLVTLWGKELSNIEGQGAMISVAASVDDIAPLLKEWGDRLAVAAINSNKSVTLSGATTDTNALLDKLTKAGFWAWKVPGGEVAGHSPQVDIVKAAVIAQAPRNILSSAHAVYYSSVAGARYSAEDFQPDYWYRILRETVLFENSIRALINDGHRLFIEVSPHPVLTSIIEEHLRAAGVKGAAISTLDRRKNDKESLLYSLAHAFINGASIDWTSVFTQLLPQQADGYYAALAGVEEASSVAGATSSLSANSVSTTLNDDIDRVALGNRSPSEQYDILLGLVSREVETLLGETFSSDMQAFRDIGFTSLTVVEFSRGLSIATGIELPSTLVYDHPTPRALSEYLRQELGLSSSDDGQEAQETRHHDEPIAIIGMACRYPGNVNSPEALWDLLVNERDAIGDYPSDRGWDVNKLYDPEAGKFGKISTRTSGFLYEAPLFDAGFFGISPREALTLEPQQRLLLEVSWEAIERAGIDPSGLYGSNTGIYAGIMATEYGSQIQHASEDVSGYGYMGTATCVASGRVAYSLGLHGPAVTIDTACSSSLVAIHTACEALRSNDCKLALAGGITIMPTPGVLIDFSQQRVLAPDGRCKAFSTSADGVGLSEGIGMLLLEPLSQAQANGHKVLGVIRGSAVNQDGASNGLTAPNGSAQQKVIRHALANAGLKSQDVDVVEAHGTGTRLGDPIEANALMATYGRQRSAEQPLLLGSIKSNIGHTQAAAGVAGLIKMLMAFRHNMLPRSLHITEPSHEVDWSSGAIKLLSASQPWPQVGDRPYRAAISSFGVSGTNSHLIVEQPPRDPIDHANAVAVSAPQEMLWPIAAKTDTALRKKAAQLREYLASNHEIDPINVGYSLGISRSQFPYRAAVRGQSKEALVKGLQALENMQDDSALTVGTSPANESGKLFFVFPGQGSQWPEMGMELYNNFSVYRQAIDEVDSALRAYVDWSLIDVLRGNPGTPPLDRVDVVQPALFAVMTALARLWQSFGFTPHAVVGHSQGEIAAAYIASALSLQDAIRIVALRSRLMLSQSGHGAMATLGLSEEQTRAFLSPDEGEITLAVFNSPTSTVVSGDTRSIETLLQRCKKARVRAKRIAVDVAGHSPQLDTLRPILMELFSSVKPNATRIPFYSTVGGHVSDAPLDGTTLGAKYWCDNLCHPVHFFNTVSALSKNGKVTFLECSPHAVLLPALEETTDNTATIVGSMQRNKSAVECLTQAMAHLYVSGHSINWRALHPDASLVDIPTYPFEHRHYWLTPPTASNVVTVGQRPTEHALLNAIIDLPDDEGVLLTGRIGLSSQPWLADHAATGVALVPGTAYLDMVSYAALLTDHHRIAELVIQAPLVLPEQGELDLQLRVGRIDEQALRAVTIHARLHNDEALDATEWTLYANALLQRGVSKQERPFDNVDWPPAGAEPLDLTRLHQRLSAAGYEYGAAFKGLSAAWRHGDSVYAEASLPEELSTNGHLLHPALLDTVLHTIALPDSEDDDATTLRLPFALSGITLADKQPRQLRARLNLKTNDNISLIATDETGETVISIETLNLRETTRDKLRNQLRIQPEYDLLRTTWSPLPSASKVKEAPATASWGLLESDLDGTSPLDIAVRYESLRALSAGLTSSTLPTVLVWPLPVSDSAKTDNPPYTTRSLCEQVIEQLQLWLSDERLANTTLLVITRRATEHASHECLDVAHSAAWALLHSAQNENPGRIVLLDTDSPLTDTGLLSAALASDRPQLAQRQGQLLIPHLARTVKTGLLTPPSDSALWRLDISDTGNLDNLMLKPAPEANAPLGRGQIRLSVRAAGVNFYDVVCALGLIAPQHEFGTEAAGVITEVGPDVKDFNIGDRVMVLTEGAFGPTVIANQTTTFHLPENWTFAQAAGVPIAFLTAYYALTQLASLRKGERVLIHAAAGGVGQAAIQLAHHLGAEVFATAHPDKWPILRQLGIAGDHIASSRNLEFTGKFRPQLTGKGIDVVLNSLTGEFIDASMSLMASGGRFIELGKTDIRENFPTDLTYHYLDRPDSSPKQTAEMLTTLLSLMRAGSLAPLPITAFDIREAIQAFRLMQQGRHTGKVVLTFSQPLNPDGTVLITGGTGTLAGLLAHHLVEAHQVKNLILASRRGARADGAAQLKAKLENMGATVEIVACDTTDPLALDKLLAAIPDAHPLTGVFHTAGVLADATIANLTAESLDTVFSPKIDAVWHLHQKTRTDDLAAFVLYSSSAGTLGSPGQGNYSAANKALDTLAHNRRREGLCATSLAWGWWQPVTELSSRLSETDNARIARTGLAPITPEHGNAMIDAALALPYAVYTAAPLNPQMLRKNMQSGRLHPLFERLAGPALARRASSGGEKAPDLRQSLSPLEPGARLKQLQVTIVDNIAGILGLDNGSLLVPEQSFKESGIDSLMALELRNRLSAISGLRLPATMTYDYPTPVALAEYLDAELFSGLDMTMNETITEENELYVRERIAGIPLASLRDAGLLEKLIQIADGTVPVEKAPRNVQLTDIEFASIDELVSMALSDKDNAL
ncbi:MULTISPECIES: type I polyketide synthase [Brenneria]|uniref:KR domain-containing protein n=1 Tax=Brenneria nigrifluens DSM 30175 = ATCC 13028 TaxID=1121120 RepID=A0A2U1UP44_9GAMM|nr:MULTISPECIES: type I polyketide synthase [Brenneria]EHD23259.1 6-deoxyerythronolide-B synthase., NADPH:quinone reductase [Brenneria sp. EniD312]PWC23449.1 KR domain-containing protein [Brenneria nigrifluens DSM 30175 = ATCC 13028]QCR06192.1 type I polyketide synthase [Brenneria nigrifluens DSM 30175 = ATCC 13028]